MTLLPLRAAAAELGYKTPDRLLRYLREEAPEIGVALGLDLMGSGSYGVDAARWQEQLPELRELAREWKAWRRANLGRYAQPGRRRSPVQGRTRPGRG